MSKLKLAGGMIVALIALLIPFTLGAISGAIGMATTALVVAGGAYFLGFITMNTAQTIAIYIVGAGALLGGIVWSLVTVAGVVGQ